MRLLSLLALTLAVAPGFAQDAETTRANKAVHAQEILGQEHIAKTPEGAAYAEFLATKTNAKGSAPLASVVYVDGGGTTDPVAPDVDLTRVYVTKVENPTFGLVEYLPIPALGENQTTILKFIPTSSASKVYYTVHEEGVATTPVTAFDMGNPVPGTYTVVSTTKTYRVMGGYRMQTGANRVWLRTSNWSFPGATGTLILAGTDFGGNRIGTCLQLK